MIIITIESTLKTLSVLNNLRDNSRPGLLFSLFSSKDMITIMPEMPKKISAI